MFLAWNEIRKNLKKFILIILIVVLISYLVCFLVGLAYGLAKSNRTAVDLWEGKQILLSEGANSNLLGSIMDYEEIENFDPGEASPVNISTSSCYRNQDKNKDEIINIALIGIDYTSKLCPTLVEGNMPQDLFQVVASVDLKNEEGVKLGDTLELTQTDRIFTVVGFSESAKFSTLPVVYTDLFMNSPGMQIMKPVDQADIMSGPTPEMPPRIGGLVLHEEYKGELGEELDLITIDDFIHSLPGYLPQVLTFGLMIGFLILISAIVLGVFLYIVTIQKKNIFGVMKIQGISNGYISASVMLQTLILVSFGVAIGIGLTYLTGLVIPDSVPFIPKFMYFLTIGVLMILTSVLGAIFSVVSVSKIDPLDVLE